MRALLALGTAFLVACSAPAQPAASPTVAATTAATPAPTSAATGAAATATATTSLSAPDCRAPATPTTAQTEGPFYKADPPERTSLVSTGTQGTKIIVTGFVLSRSCRPLANARVDFWQADAQGNYDNTGFNFRGYQQTNAQGIYRLETIVPAEYPGRTAHIHVKVTPQGGSTLTSQLYFPNVARNSSDGIFNASLLVKLEQGTPLLGRFDFVVDVP